MINFQKIEVNIENLRDSFASGVIEHVIIDDFLYRESAIKLLNDFPDPIKTGINKSRDYFFAKNKFEKSNLEDVSENFRSFYTELLSDRFRKILKQITGEDVFLDPQLFGGGLHQGGSGSFLNMHADFNYHPINRNWFRNLNILIYFNLDWQPEFGGSLKLLNKNTGENAEIAPLFNRCVVMFTRDYTLHGYDRINFPEGQYRRSVAAYAYSIADTEPHDVRSTAWYPDDGGIWKKILGAMWPRVVAIKSRLMGSSASKNR